MATAVYNPRMPDDEDSLERAIAGALRDAISQHGPITLQNMNSAIKRVAGNLRNARLSGMAAALGRRRWAGVSDEDLREHQADAARAGWKSMTKAERSAEMSRRRKLGLKKK